VLKVIGTSGACRDFTANFCLTLVLSNSPVHLVHRRAVYGSTGGKFYARDYYANVPEVGKPGTTISRILVVKNAHSPFARPITHEREAAA
jgi:hypothetical protein